MSFCYSNTGIIRLVFLVTLSLPLVLIYLVYKLRPEEFKKHKISYSALIYVPLAIFLLFSLPQLPFVELYDCLPPRLEVIDLSFKEVSCNSKLDRAELALQNEGGRLNTDINISVKNQGGEVIRRKKLNWKDWERGETKEGTLNFDMAENETYKFALYLHNVSTAKAVCKTSPN